MFNNCYLKYVFFILFSFCVGSISAQLSKTHYIPPLTNAEFGNANPEDQYIYLSTPSGADIPYVIKPVGQPVTSYITGIVSNANPQQVSLGTGYGQLFIPSTQTSTVVNNRGYIIEAEGTIYVSVRMNAGGGAQAGALVSKGLSALGNTFRVGSYTNGNPQDNYLNFVSVMATEDNTQVTFSDLPAGLIIKNYTGTTPVTATLNKGESYSIATNCLDSVTNRDGLIGCLVNSDKPIVVNCGSTNGSFGTGGGRDYGIDQIVDLSKVGTEYIFVRGDGDNAWENVLIVAHTDNTAISINGNAPVTTINAGQHWVIEGNNYNASGNMYVQTTQPVFAYQGVGGLGNNGTPNEANQGMFFVPPLSCEARGNLDNIANINNIGSTNYTGGVSIVTKVGATVTINNTPVASFNTIGPSAVIGKPDYITYKVKGLNGNISVQSSDELYCAYFNYNGSATSGSFYSGFPSAPEINFNAQFATLGNCIPNIKLEAANTQNFDSFQWLFDDGSGSGFVDLMVATPDITPLLPGKYKLIGVIACTGDMLESIEVPVSICPDDVDNDGIIDNIDIDNDNDGILNCTESIGDVIINIANTNAPQLIFQDNSTNNTIASASLVQNNSSGNTTNTISGTNNGNFTSVVQPANSAESSYDMLFTEAVNIKFSEAIGITHNITAGEFFIAKILPANKNITLLDPDNRLLVDTNFDGVFETGVIQESGSEIHFKVNPTPLGNTPYQFLAYKVDGFSLIHRLVNTTNPSTFTGNISLSCFKIDTDSDGIEDDLDLDSDNDGIPDIIENQGTLVTLSNIDTDFNGLDDVFDITANPIDTDTDGVFDFYDLDSDNDGIYDVFESGSNLPDTDFNGIIDNVTTSIGINGWDDNAETTPDSGAIGYTLNDLDTDTIFSYMDSDSDGDTCSDVLEAGFSDVNGDSILGDNIATTNNLGVVDNATDGYTLPNSDYLTAAPITITAQPVDTEVCELSDAIISVTNTAVDTIQWELSTDGINWTTIIDDATYSGSQTNDLTISATPLTFDTYQYRAFLNVAGNSCGLYTDEIEITVIELPVANTAPNMLQCDDDNNGTIQFNLILQNSSINTTAGMTITYHASQADANTGKAPLASPYESGNTTIFARVVNDLNTTCYATSSFDLEVYDLPFPIDTPFVTPIQECDNTSIGTDTDGFIVFDLTQRETEILNGQSIADFAFTYFTDASGLPPAQILNPTAYSKTSLGVETIYVRVSNRLYNACSADTTFDIEVFELPVANNPNLYSQCDDASNDGQAFFNLELDTIKEEININYISEGLTFTFYEIQTEAETNGVAIATPTNYQDAPGFTPETIWVRAENPNGCFRVVPLTLEVSPSSAALSSYTPNSIYQCDDGADDRDGIATFDLTTIQNHISTTIFSTFNVTVHFYESQLDAELETNEILDPANHQNTNAPNSQDIWVRVKSDLGNNCMGLERFPNLLIVEALPIANQVPNQIACDNDTNVNDGRYPFNTSLIESTILNGQSLANVSINYTYLDTDGVTVINTSNLPNPLLSQSQIMTVRVTNNNTSDPDGPCYDESTIGFVVDEQPIANPIPAQIVCDGDAGDIDDDGIYPFDTSTFISTLRGAQTGMDIYFDYLDENGVLVTNSSTLPNPLISANQTISVEVINPINTTCTATTDIILTVNPLPNFSVDTPQIVCTSDPTFTVTLDPIEGNNSETFTYEWAFQDGSILSNASTLEVSVPGTYSISLTKTDGTNCSRTLDILVDASEKATITQDDVTIIDISENNSVSINPANLGSGDYEYALREKDDPFIVYQEEPDFTNVKAGFYTIYVKDDICGVSTLEISVIGHAKFFTPNGDGNNDTWQIKGINSNFQSQSDIYIFDRYGKLMKQINTSSDGWDGTFNGELMPSDDYWFKVLLEDGRNFMGHFTLKR